MNEIQKEINTDNLNKFNQETKSLTREYIKTALLYLLRDHPYEKITVTAIINRAGVSRAGFYRNYASKEEVLKDLAATVYYQVSNIVFHNEELKSPYDKYVFFFQKLKTNAEWFQTLSMLSAQSRQLFGASTYLQYHPQAQSALEHYQNVAAFHSQRAVILDWFENGMKESPEEMAEIFSHIYKNIFE